MDNINYQTSELGFIRIAAICPELKIGNVDYNCQQIKKMLLLAKQQQVELAVFPELSICGYSLADLFYQESLHHKIIVGLLDLVKFSKTLPLNFVVGLPMVFNGRLYNVAALIGQGKIYGITPKQNLANSQEYYERRWFSSGSNIYNQSIIIDTQEIPFGTNLIFKHRTNTNFKLGLEICEDLWVVNPPSSQLCLAGATVIANIAASSAIVGKFNYIIQMIRSHAAKAICAYIYAGGNSDESTTDNLFSSQLTASQLGKLMFNDQTLVTGKIKFADFDLQAIAHERMINTSWKEQNTNQKVTEIIFDNPQYIAPINLVYPLINKQPFIPKPENSSETFAEVIEICSKALYKRLQHIQAKTLIIGLSGGLDSTLALLIAIECLKNLNYCKILAVSMPTSANSSLTKQNVKKLCSNLDINCLFIDIDNLVDSCLQAGKISTQEDRVAYENTQARIRTMLLMNLANKHHGLMLGTSDLSEIALGWSTFNGDHMSMYHLLAGIPKTLVQHLISYFSTKHEYKKIKPVLESILKTPISPELLGGNKSRQPNQLTEEILGKYELHDFFLFYMLRHGYGPKKMFYLAKETFKYDQAEIIKTLQIFTSRFFANQFKRSAMPDSPKVGTVSLSPRADWRMPSDADASLWTKEIEDLSKKLLLK